MLLNDSSLPPSCSSAPRPAPGLLHVERGVLARVLAVAQPLRALERERDACREPVVVLRGEPACDRGVVRRGVLEHLARERPAQRRCVACRT